MPGRAFIRTHFGRDLQVEVHPPDESARPRKRARLVDVWDAANGCRQVNAGRLVDPDPEAAAIISAALLEDRDGFPFPYPLEEAHGHELDVLVESLFGLKRVPGEPDGMLRLRAIAEAAMRLRAAKAKP